MYVCNVIHVTKSWRSHNGCEVGELPESFFTPTAHEIKVAQATLTSRTQALNNAPLQLRATREAAEKAKRDRWPNVGRAITGIRCGLTTNVTDHYSNQI